MVLFSLVLFLDAITVSGNAIAIDGLRIAPEHFENIEEGKLPSLNALRIGQDISLIAFGLGISDGTEIVLTPESTNVDENCGNFMHTAPIEIKPYSPGKNGVLYSDTDAENSTNTTDLDRKNTLGLIEITADFSTDNNLIGGKTYFICVKNADQWLHVGNSTLQSVKFAEQKRDTILPPALQVVIIVLLLMLSGTFSGLNLGLMALDPQQLKLLMDAGDPDEKKFAKKVLPCRSQGNFLLCTLLLGNVLVNNTLTIFLDDLTSGTVAIVGATAGIVIFGEIIPQAICSRHGLLIGYKTLPLTYMFMFITGILSYPLGKLLDYILGDEVGMSYNRERLVGLIKQGQNDLDEDEKNMIEGALKLNEKAVKEVMTHINYVFTVPEDAIIDYDFMSKITEAGYSRIPVTKSSTSGNGDITGLLFLRDLVMVDPDDRIEVSTVTNYYKHQLKEVDENTKLDDMLETFKEGAYHLSLVTKDVDTGSNTTTKEITGIITLEDIIEEIICAEIVDETDKYVDNKARIQNTKREKMDPQFIENLKKIENSNPREMVNPNNPDNLEPIGRGQTAAVLRFLVAEVKPFSHELIAESQIKMLLAKQDFIVYVKRSDNTAPIIERGKPINGLFMVIEGKCEILFGPDEIPIEAGSFRTFGISSLMDVKLTKEKKDKNLGTYNKYRYKIPSGFSLKPPNSSHELRTSHSQTIQPSPVLNEVTTVRSNDEWRTGSCPPGNSVPVTPVTTPTGSQHISDFTVRIVSEEFVYLRVSRSDYRNMRNQFEIRQAQKVSSIDNITNINENKRPVAESTTDNNDNQAPEKSSEKTKLLE